MLGIPQYLFRLVPGNPILRRVVATAGNRQRDLFFRCAYLGLLTVIVIFMLLQGGSGQHDLTSLAKQSQQIFYTMSHVQLVLVVLLAPIFTAGAITQEKDSQTYDILLSTPLTNGQIVLGSLLSRLFFIVSLLFSGIPIFAITQIFGGVAIINIVQAFLIAAATATITGALAIAIATFKVGTRRTIFTFCLLTIVVVSVPCVVESMGYLQFKTDPASPYHTSWLAGVNPFLAMRVIFNTGNYAAPPFGDPSIAGKAWIVQQYLAAPERFFVVLMFTASLVLVLPSIVLLRRMAQSTTSFRTRILQALHIPGAGDKKRKPRNVWNNPIAWREAKTRGSAARAMVLRYAFMALGSALAVGLLWVFARQAPAKPVVASRVNAADRTIEMNDRGTLSTMRLAPSTEFTFLPDRDTYAPPPSRYNGYSYTTGTYGAGQESNLAVGEVEPGMMVHSKDVDQASGLVTRLSLSHPVGALKMQDVRSILLGAIIIEMSVILLIVTQAAASTVTREKEDGTLDLLLSSPITSRYYVWGKLRGLVSFVLPLIAVPVFTVLLWVVYDGWWNRGHGPAFQRATLMPEAVLLLPPAIIVVTAFGAILGMSLSLRSRTTIMAVMSSVGILAAVCFGLGACGMYIGVRGGREGSVLFLSSVSPFSLATVLISPDAIGDVRIDAEFFERFSARLPVFIASIVMTAVYALVVHTMYRSMVKNFDMTIRRQSR